MRLKGTGTDPDHKYPDGLVFDAPPHAARSLVDAGFATVLDPKDDPARTPSQIAAAVQRGDNLNDPTDAELAAGISDREALAAVHGEPVDEPVPGGGEARAPIGVGPEVLPDAPGLANATPADEETSAPRPPSNDSSKGPTPKQQAVERAKELDVSHSGSQAEIEERITAKEKELEEQNAPASEELSQRATELEVDATGTTAEVEARIAAKEQELASAGGASS